MANANIARGFIPVCSRDGRPYSGASRVFHVPASYGTALFVGDPVIHVTDASDANGIPTVARATAGSGAYMVGVMVGVVAAGDPPVAVTRDLTVYHPASTLGYIMVATDPDLLFEAQEDSVGGVMTVGAAGRNADFIVGTGSTVTGYSGCMIDSNTLNTTATLQFRIVAPVERADNDPTLDYAKWLVSINLHSYRNTTGV
jgi:hypothetical protein